MNDRTPVVDVGRTRSGRVVLEITLPPDGNIVCRMLPAEARVLAASLIAQADEIEREGTR